MTWGGGGGEEGVVPRVMLAGKREWGRREGEETNRNREGREGEAEEFVGEVGRRIGEEGRASMADGEEGKLGDGKGF